MGLSGWRGRMWTMPSKSLQTLDCQSSLQLIWMMLLRKLALLLDRMLPPHFCLDCMENSFAIQRGMTLTDLIHSSLYLSLGFRSVVPTNRISNFSKIYPSGHNLCPEPESAASKFI